MLQRALGASLAHVGLALRTPEEFTLVWHRRATRYGGWVWLGLAATAVLGTMTYGLTLGIHAGPQAMLRKATLLTLAAGLSWAIPLPALYILNSLAGSRLRASTTLLAALVTTSWGGLALVASVPINWFFSVAVPTLPHELFGASAIRWIVSAVNVAVFLGVGVAMSDVFCRVVERLEPLRGRQPGWVLLLVGSIGLQLSYVFGLFQPGV
ncbi:MAG TPA: hypothetical protein VGX78_12485 [Pirellulales bacterium]|nr:hypothetical protein [Pirellulales bacterium]